MLAFHKIFTSIFGIGYAKGGGTLAAIFCCICWYVAWAGSAAPPLLLSLAITVAVTVIGIWSSTVVEKIWGKDPSRVVVDEVAGMCVGLLFIPVELKYVITGLFLFRFFDIVKPLYIRKMENLPSGWGIMMDDILSGVYTNILLYTIVWFKLF